MYDQEYNRKAYMERIQALRFSGAAGPHKSLERYPLYLDEDDEQDFELFDWLGDPDGDPK
jgi:hypothetical protein